MIEPPIYFWATLRFENEQLLQWLASQVDLSRAPWRPSFFYPGERAQGYMIFPIAREGEEFGFHALNPEFWENVHRHRLKVGSTFLLGLTTERLQATGAVTRIVHD